MGSTSEFRLTWAADYEMTVWPLRDEPQASLRLAAVLTLLAVAAGWLGGSLLLGLGAWLALLVSAWPMWVPVKYELGPAGLTQRLGGRVRRVPWHAVASCQLRRSGVLMTTTSQQTPWAAIRGLYVRCGRDRVAELAAAIGRHHPDALPQQ